MPSSPSPRISRFLDWNFPLPRPYTGVLMGNGTLGLMVWGREHLNISIARNGFWDRRGGIPFAAKTNFKQVRELLEAGRMEELKRAFANEEPAATAIPYSTPTQLPGGRLELRFAGPPRRARLAVGTGHLFISFGEGIETEIVVHPSREIAWIGGSMSASVRLIPAWHWLEKTLAPGGVEPPSVWEHADGGGFCQRLPKDPSLTVEWFRTGGGILISTRIGDGTDGLPAPSGREISEEADRWWEEYTATVPRVDLPDPALQRAWDYGLHKQAGMTPPQGVAATLQGPWMAETELPPWSNDYHFNINLQMIYWPCLPTNRPGHLDPVWRMIEGWLPRLRENAAAFFDNPSALMLPHAVDDRCQVIGNFWQGTIDQACTAWMAQIAWLHYRHTLDRRILGEIAWPLLVGAFEGFWSMTEERKGGLSLPVSVSAEFPGWGRDASFQLAAFHMVARLLPVAAALLGKPEDKRWERVRKELPRFTTMPLSKVWGKDEPPRQRIVLWEGQDLTESHRHHSHLAGISPFNTLDPMDEETREVIRHSIQHWATMGGGQWTGWSMPWAAMIWARCNQASAAVSVLRIWEDVFTNEGGGTLHNADHPGFSAWIHGPFLDPPEIGRNDDQMQMDAGFGAMQALAEIFVQQRGATLHILPSLPKQWRDFSFDGILCEGAILAGARVSGGAVVEIRLKSLHGGPIDVALPGIFEQGGTLAARHHVVAVPGQEIVFLPPKR